MSTVRHAAEERTALSVDPAVFLRVARESRARAGFWGPWLFRSARRAGTEGPRARLHQLARAWRPYFESNPGLDPGRDLREVILASEDLSLRDKRQIEKLWALGARLKPEELARAVRPAIDRIVPKDAGEALWRDVLRAAARDPRGGRAERGLKLAVPSDATVRGPLVRDAIQAYLQAILVLDRLRQDRREFLARRTRQLQTIAGVVEGPADFSERHTEYASHPAR